MLSFFTAPKPFEGHIGVIQRNALRSWARIPQSELLFFGDEDGTASLANELGAKHIPDVALSPLGTPLVGDMFERTRLLATRPVACFVNADVILTTDLVDAVRRVQDRRFLLVGQRWDIEVRNELDFDEGWEAALAERVAASGRLHAPAGSDYFAYPADVDWQMPPFAIGRVGWDNWTLHRARELSLDVIDATRVVRAIHQDHEYSPTQRPVGPLHEAPEAAENLRLMEGRMSTLHHTRYILTKRRLLPALQPSKLLGRAVGSRAVSAARRRAHRIVPW